ncbi:hypothetical protein ALC152_04460 [Arcobacter sp. 15-2]|uniref:hypothetical protein n=1 Tax=Arcobacter sp. 15-2 TaxID=3374109 RepID=UPI00399D273C
MKIWSTIKLILISAIALIVLTFLTVDTPKKIEKKEITLQDLPKTVELIGFEEQEFNAASIIKKDILIFVGNHESIVLADKLDKMLNVSVGKFVIVSNISDAPWFIKRWQAHTKNTKLKGEKNIPWIYDRDGKIRNFLQVPTTDALKYFIYKVDNNGIVKSIYIGKVKPGTIDGKMNEKEINDNLKEAIKSINKN